MWCRRGANMRVRFIRRCRSSRLIHPPVSTPENPADANRSKERSWTPRPGTLIAILQASIPEVARGECGSPPRPRRSPRRSRTAPARPPIRRWPAVVRWIMYARPQAMINRVSPNTTRITPPRRRRCQRSASPALGRRADRAAKNVVVACLTSVSSGTAPQPVGAGGIAALANRAASRGTLHLDMTGPYPL